MVFRDSDVVQEVHERMEEVRTRKRTRRQSLAVNASVLARKRKVTKQKPVSAAIQTNEGQVSTVIVPSNLEKPKFTGKEVIPMQFLTNFDTYAAHFKWDESQKLAAVKGCLVEDAAIWVRLFMGRWKKFSDFTRDFSDQYWSEETQGTIRRKIELDCWDRKVHPEMSTHFAYYAGLAQALDPPIPEHLAVSSIMKHFPFSIQTGWMISDKRTIVDTMQYLIRQNEMFKQRRNGDKPREVRVNAQEVHQRENRKSNQRNHKRSYRDGRRRTPDFKLQKRDYRQSRNQRQHSRDRHRSSSREKSEKSRRSDKPSTTYNRVPPPSAGNSPGPSAKKRER